MVKSVASINLEIGRRYAKALFEEAQQFNVIEIVEKQLLLVNFLFEQNINLAKALQSPICTKVKLQHLVDIIQTELFEAQQSEDQNILYKFLTILVKKGRFPLLPSIFSAFQNLTMAWRNQIKAELIVAQPMDEAEQKQLCANIKEFVNRDVLLTTHIDKSIIGGFIVKFDSYQLDESILTKLQSLKCTLREVS